MKNINFYFLVLVLVVTFILLTLGNTTLGMCGMLLSLLLTVVEYVIIKQIGNQ